MVWLKQAEKRERQFLNPIETKVGGFRLIFRMLPLLLSNRAETFPKRKLGPFFTDPRAYEVDPESGLRVTWMGHSTSILEIDGVRLLIDPVWEERASPLRWAGPRRFFAPPLPLKDLPQIDAVIVSHNHYDHFGAGTIRRLSRSPAVAGAKWVTSLGVGPALRRCGVSASSITELDWTQSIRVQSLRSERECQVTALPARHFSGRGFSDRFRTLWSSFALTGQTHKVYFGADSGWWEGFGEIGSAYPGFDLVMLEIGAYNELWKDIHLGPDGAAKAFQAIGSGGLLMPIHWGLFDLALHGWRQPIDRLIEISDSERLKLWLPQPGEPTEVVAGRERRSRWWEL